MKKALLFWVMFIFMFYSLALCEDLGYFAYFEMCKGEEVTAPLSHTFGMVHVEKADGKLIFNMWGFNADFARDSHAGENFIFVFPIEGFKPYTEYSASIFDVLDNAFLSKIAEKVYCYDGLVDWCLKNYNDDGIKPMGNGRMHMMMCITEINGGYMFSWYMVDWKVKANGFLMRMGGE